MRKRGWMIVLVASLFTVSLYAQKEPINDSVKTEIVVNLKMIEMYNNMKESEVQLNFYQIMQKYSLDEAKIVLHAYRNHLINETNKSSIDNFLAKLNEDTNSIYKKEPLGNLITEEVKIY